MIKKIFHISDIHVKINKEHNEYEEIFNNVVDSITDNSKELSFHEIRIVITGDIFHNKIVISNEQIVLVTNFLRKLNKIGHIVIIPGNHDFLEKNHSKLDSITPVIVAIDSETIKYHKYGGVYKDENIDWVVYSLYEDNKRPEIKPTNNKLIGLFHGPISGMSTDINYQFDDDAYDKSIFSDLDLVLCGDIHKRQVFSYGKTKGIMVGSLIQQNFGENINNHGYCIIDAETLNHEFVEIENNNQYLHFKINDFSTIERNEEKINNLW